MQEGAYEDQDRDRVAVTVEKGDSNTMQTRKRLTVSQKRGILLKLGEGWGRREILEHFGISESALSEIRKRADLLMQQDLPIEGKRITRKPGEISLDDVILADYINLCGCGVVFTGRMLQEIALVHAKLLGKTEFSASKGWLDKFLTRSRLKTPRSDHDSIFVGQSAHETQSPETQPSGIAANASLPQPASPTEADHVGASMLTSLPVSVMKHANQPPPSLSTSLSSSSPQAASKHLAKPSKPANSAKSTEYPTSKKTATREQPHENTEVSMADAGQSQCVHNPQISFGSPPRHGCGELPSLISKRNSQICAHVQQNILESGVGPEDVYNLVETSLFYDWLPDTSFESVLNETQNRKNRISILLCCNSTGTVKIPPLFIGHQQRPICLRNVSIQEMRKSYIDCPYGLLNMKRFEKWLVEFDDSLCRPSILLLTNVPCHFLSQSVPLKHTRLIYFPVGTCFPKQPLECGVVQAVKFKFRKLVLQNIFQRYLSESRGDISPSRIVEIKKVTISDTIHLVSQVWASIQPSLVRSSWAFHPVLPDFFPESGTARRDTVSAYSEVITGLEYIHQVRKSFAKDVGFPTNLGPYMVVTFVAESTTCSSTAEEFINALDRNASYSTMMQIHTPRPFETSSQLEIHNEDDFFAHVRKPTHQLQTVQSESDATALNPDTIRSLESRQMHENSNKGGESVGTITGKQNSQTAYNHSQNRTTLYGIAAQSAIEESATYSLLHPHPQYRQTVENIPTTEHNTLDISRQHGDEDAQRDNGLNQSEDIKRKIDEILRWADEKKVSPFLLASQLVESIGKRAKIDT